MEIFNYVYGGIICLLGFIPLIYVVLGTVMTGGFLAEHAQEEFPHFVGPILMFIGAIAFLIIEAWGIINIVNGRLIGNRKGRVFSMVIGGLNCLLGGIFGIALGVFTLIMMSKDDVQQEYQENRELLTDRAY